MDLHPDFRDLLAEFARFEVKYVLLGGYAVGYYAEPRATKDLDVLVSIEGNNRKSRLTSRARRLEDSALTFYRRV